MELHTKTEREKKLYLYIHKYINTITCRSVKKKKTIMIITVITSFDDTLRYRSVLFFSFFR